MRILLEASTESEWVAQHLETLDHEVTDADPNYAPMYGQRSRRVKTDRRDVAALTEACRRGIYRSADRRSTRHMRYSRHSTCAGAGAGKGRERSSLTRAITRAAGLRVRCGRTETFQRGLDALDLAGVHQGLAVAERNRNA
jgi:hypothetical protein